MIQYGRPGDKFDCIAVDMTRESYNPSVACRHDHDAPVVEAVEFHGDAAAASPEEEKFDLVLSSAYVCPGEDVCCKYCKLRNICKGDKRT